MPKDLKGLDVHKCFEQLNKGLNLQICTPVIVNLIIYVL